MKEFKLISTTIVYILLGIILAFGINQGLAFALSTDMPIVAVESNSMVPTFQKGDILILQGIQPDQLKIGDIIVFSSPQHSTPIVHRIIKINPDKTFQTKGDANTGQLPFEKHITPSQIHGKKILIIPYLGWVKIGLTEFILPNILWIILAGSIIIFMRIALFKAK
jgi:signal peptidase